MPERNSKIVVEINNIKKLLNRGFTQSKVHLYPPRLVKLVDKEKKLLLSVGNGEPCINFWDGEDKHYVGVVSLITCSRLDPGLSYFEYSDETYSAEDIEPYLEHVEFKKG